MSEVMAVPLDFDCKTEFGYFTLLFCIGRINCLIIDMFFFNLIIFFNK